ncbi:hypothetical protein DMUE_6270, partial [Dictyocoela muelleri]
CFMDRDLEKIFLMLNNLIKEMLCMKCLGNMKRIKGKNVLKCTRNKCRFERVLFSKKPFYNSKLSVETIIKIIYLLTKKYKFNQIIQIVNVDYNAIRRILKYLYIILEKEEKEHPVKIGGDNIIVEVDESKFGKRKYNRGHRVKGTWVIGGVERTPERRIFLKEIARRNSENISNILNDNIAPNSIIYTDMWRGYNNININFRHLTVNHSEGFINRENNVHTNTIEGTWFAIKNFISKDNYSNKNLKYLLKLFTFLR